MFRRILVPTDGSALSERAAAAAVALARGCGAEIVALSLTQAGPPLGARALELATERAARVARLADVAGVPRRQVTAVVSEQHDEIIRTALALDCDLIFMAAHGQCGVNRLIADRVPQLVLAYAPLPVILYRSGAEPA